MMKAPKKATVIALLYVYYNRQQKDHPITLLAKEWVSSYYRPLSFIQ